MSSTHASFSEDVPLYPPQVEASSSTNDEGWAYFTPITYEKFDEVRIEWRIVKENMRKNTEDRTVYMICKAEGCPVEYKARTAFKLKLTDNILE